MPGVTQLLIIILVSISVFFSTQTWSYLLSDVPLDSKAFSTYRWGLPMNFGREGQSGFGNSLESLNNSSFPLRLLSQVGLFISPRIKHQTCRFSRTLSWKLFVENLKLIYFTSKEDLNLNTCDIPTNWSMNTQTWSRGWYWFNSHVHYHHKTIVFKESRRCLNIKSNCQTVWHIASCEWSWVICCPLSASFAPKIFSIWKLGHLGRYLATGQLSW